MKPIVGEIDYKELSAEDISRFTREAEKLRAEAMREMFVGMFKAISGGFRGLVANPGIHPSPRAH